MSQQKFASNVVEKCLAFGGPAERELLVNEMLGTTDENEPLQVCHTAVLITLLSVLCIRKRHGFIVSLGRINKLCHISDEVLSNAMDSRIVEVVIMGTPNVECRCFLT